MRLRSKDKLTMASPATYINRMGHQEIVELFKKYGAKSAILQEDNVRPAVLRPHTTESVGISNFEDLRHCNLIIEGDNAPVLKTLCAGELRLEGKVDFMLWDPPYNTGKNDFLYEDNFYLTKKEQAAFEARRQSLELEGLTVGQDTRDPRWVKETNASRHSLWLSFMELRLELARKLLKESGIIAVHISYQELFRLGLLMDEVFGEDNRLGIINWECSYSAKNNNDGIPSTTDYILIYAKNKELAFKGALPRTDSMDSRYQSKDGDKEPWSSGDLSVGIGPLRQTWGIQNPLTKSIAYPAPGRQWIMTPDKAMEHLAEWGVSYLFDREQKALVVDKSKPNNFAKRYSEGSWPSLYFTGKNGSGRPRLKRYRKNLRQVGRIVGTYWESDEILDNVWDEDEQLQSSLRHEISSHNDAAKKLLNAMLGKKATDGGKTTPKPLKLTERLLEMFCPKDGVVMDAFAGSGTTGHAVLSLNAQGAQRRFILIERGSSSNGFCNTLTAERIRVAISGEWAKKTKDTVALGGSFAYVKALPAQAECCHRGGQDADVGSSRD